MRTEKLHLAHTLYSFDARLDIDLDIVVEELLGIAAFGVIQCKGLEFGVLLFLGCYTYLHYL